MDQQYIMPLAAATEKLRVCLAWVSFVSIFYLCWDLQIFATKLGRFIAGYHILSPVWISLKVNKLLSRSVYDWSYSRVNKVTDLTGLMLSANSLPIHQLPIHSLEVYCQFVSCKKWTNLHTCIMRVLAHLIYIPNLVSRGDSIRENKVRQNVLIIHVCVCVCVPTQPYIQGPEHVSTPTLGGPS